jgi:hypothetical protein
MSIKVYELIGELSKFPADAVVEVVSGPGNDGEYYYNCQAAEILGIFGADCNRLQVMKLDNAPLVLIQIQEGKI